MAILVFTGALFLIIYAYIGYPALMFALSRTIGREVKKADSLFPKVSIIIAAFNEERDIGAKLVNTLALDYPKDKLEIIVASDCSTDKTDSIVKNYAALGVRLISQPKRLGKTAAQNRAVAACTGEILLFSDATTHYDPYAVRKIIRSFADPGVGCVSGSIKYVDSAATAVGRGIRIYWSYEVFLKGFESMCGGLIGVCGCIYAVRRSNYRPLADDMCSDFVIASEMRLQGLKAVYEPEAISAEVTNYRGNDEFRMRVRIAEQTIRSLSRYRQVLNPLRHGVFALQMLTHKVLRYAVPALLLLLYLSSTAMLHVHMIFAMAVAGQTAFYAMALGGWILDRLRIRPGLLAFPYYFVLSNAALVLGSVKFVAGHSYVVWQPIRPESLDTAVTNDANAS